jgi:1,4-alpha-glucan branching enzyme
MSSGAGDLALVLHTHMPYVEGFGTWPFGEEWLFEAFAASHLPVLDAARDVTITVTPVLADQLEAEGVPDRLRDYLAGNRLGLCEADVAAVGREFAPAAEHHRDTYSAALRRLEELEGDPLAAFNAAQERGVELMASCATHAVLPLVATRAGRRLQVDVGVRAHARRFGFDGGFWLPECAYAPGVERVLADSGVTRFCVDQSAHELSAAPPPAATGAGPVAFAIDWPVVSLVWSDRGYPGDPAYADYHRLSDNGMRLWANGGGPYDPAEAAAAAGRHAANFVEAVAARLEGEADARASRPLIACAMDTEFLGHWWHEGPVWLREVLRLAPDHGVRLVTLGSALAAHPAERRELRASTWGEGKDLSTWDAPEVADYAWGARRLELRLVRELDARRIQRPAAERAARELLALQASDWAFLDKRAQAGDYPYQRTTAHSQAFLEAIDSAAQPAPRMRNLAPDLRLDPLLEP